MTYQIPTTEPTSAIAGDTLSWTKSLSDYPASTWTLTYALVQEGSQITITATPSGDDHSISVAASTTANYTVGTYHWQSYVTSGAERHTIDNGVIEILPNFATQTTGYDDRSHAKKTLDALEATIEGKATKDQLSYTIASRSIGRMSPEELIMWRNHYRAEYAREKRVANGKTNLVKVKF